MSGAPHARENALCMASHKGMQMTGRQLSTLHAGIMVLFCSVCATETAALRTALHIDPRSHWNRVETR
jgi:hypothetical protein